jgi:predicted TPR repeat methyltransferase
MEDLDSGLQNIDIKQKEESVLEMYSDFPDYDDVVVSDYKYMAYRVVPVWITELFSQRFHWPAQILDLGCGTGLGSREFFIYPERYIVTGLDLVPAMLERAARQPYNKLITSNIEGCEWPVADASTDAIIMLGVMEFIVV